MFKSKFNLLFGALFVFTLLGAMMLVSISIAGEEKGCSKGDGEHKCGDQKSCDHKQAGHESCANKDCDHKSCDGKSCEGHETKHKNCDKSECGKKECKHNEGTKECAHKDGEQKGCPHNQGEQKGCEHAGGQDVDNDAAEDVHAGAHPAIGDADFQINSSIVELESFKVMGLTLKNSLKDNQFAMDIPEFWETAMNLNLMEMISNKKRDDVILGLVMDFENETDYTYMIGCEVTGTPEIPHGLLLQSLTKNKYAKFTVTGKMPDSIGPAWEHIFMKWFPESDFDPGMTPSFEWYDSRFKPNEVSEMDIYIPIKEKSK